MGGLVSAPGAVAGALLLGVLEALVAGIWKAAYKEAAAFLVLFLGGLDPVRSPGLIALAAAHPDRGWQVRGKGMMQGLDVVDGALAMKVQAACFAAGLLIGPCGTGGRVIKLIPPLTIPEDDLDEGLTILKKAVTAVVAEGGA